MPTTVKFVPLIIKFLPTIPMTKHSGGRSAGFVVFGRQYASTHSAHAEH
jgi:hypothetical protein